MSFTVGVVPVRPNGDLGQYLDQHDDAPEMVPFRDVLVDVNLMHPQSEYLRRLTRIFTEFASVRRQTEIAHYDGMAAASAEGWQDILPQHIGIKQRLGLVMHLLISDRYPPQRAWTMQLDPQISGHL